ncbi:MAG: hypothetical protein C75L2_00650008 [Leptospirillum sp. Group II 'C75']|uniref:hypothetical protein n=1 Tax=Leptospirillum sp. Group II 'CF-1' TaxID=1660083 RepID=UPI00029CCE95|nr:hypothetical protein [Leptospirillum sp. Group II 'CF-1']AKS23666.1 hypothetical protein ABH19_07805 [Leptospirillum sp. Group II 'CF-1']EIJ75762.1 MAG: hypothetical protein C75L2_00650008 [Leptospirillum sp. Group II 'C75']
MKSSEDGEINSDKIDRVLQDWRQGDCVIGHNHWFLLRINPDSPLSDAAKDAVSDDNSAETAEEEVKGFMVTTQSCDIVRSCVDRPYIEVCPLLEVADDNLREISRNQRPNYAYIPGVADKKLVADLDRIMTVEKAVLLKWERIEGCRDDIESRNLSLSLARKRSRFAFPNDFIDLVGNLKDRLKGKHSRISNEGKALRKLREIRVKAEPSWKAKEITLIFYFIKGEDEEELGEKEWAKHLEGWLTLVQPCDRYKEINGVVLTLDDLVAREYVESDSLDLDHLSIPPPSSQY